MAKKRSKPDVLRSPTLLREYAQKFRNAYVVERTFFDAMNDQHRSATLWECPRSWDVSTGGKTLWEDIGGYLASRGVEDPEDYVRRAFSCHQTLIPPKPVDLKSPNLLTSYVRGRLEEVEMERIERLFRSENTFIRTKLSDLSIQFPGWTKQQMWKFVLLDENAPLSVLFRYCVGFDEKIKPVVDRYRRVAAVQYVRGKRFYDEVWAGWIPPKFAKNAHKIADRVIRETLGDE